MGKIRQWQSPKLSIFLLVAAVSLFSGCKLAGSFIESMVAGNQSEYEQDIERRGPGSQETWLNATGGRYDGSLPLD